MGPSSRLAQFGFERDKTGSAENTRCHQHCNFFNAFTRKMMLSAPSLMASGNKRSLRWVSLVILAVVTSNPRPSLSADSQAPLSDSDHCVALDASDGSKVEPIHLYVPDGQLRSSPLRLFVDRNISISDKPLLRLYSGHALTTKQAAEDLPQLIDYVAPDQSWTENVNGQDVTKSGTVILANISGFPIEWYKPMKRVLAVLQWKSGGKQLCAITQSPVNMGNAPIAWLWTIMAVVAVLISIAALVSSRTSAPGAETTRSQRMLTAVHLLRAGDGHLSLALTQVALWTIAVGAVTFFYGLIRFSIPVIPNSVLILMGLSLATGGLGTTAPLQKTSRNDGPGAVPPPSQSDTAGAASLGTTKADWAFSDLLYLFPKDGPPQPSLSRAQMLFWTVLIIALFVSKSAIDGVLWDVPSGMVALMGFSQAGYVGPKFFGPYAGP